LCLFGCFQGHWVYCATVVLCARSEASFRFVFSMHSMTVLERLRARASFGPLVRCGIFGTAQPSVCRRRCLRISSGSPSCYVSSLRIVRIGHDPSVYWCHGRSCSPSSAMHEFQGTPLAFMEATSRSLTRRVVAWSYAQPSVMLPRWSRSTSVSDMTKVLLIFPFGSFGDQGMAFSARYRLPYLFFCGRRCFASQQTSPLALSTGFPTSLGRFGTRIYVRLNSLL
jgi:hypothetical protein